LSHSSSPLCLGYFGDSLIFSPRLTWTIIFLFYAGMTGILHDIHTFLLRYGLVNFFAQAVLEPWSSQSQVARITGVNFQCPDEIPI
jgi:hypothetical protein